MNHEIYVTRPSMPPLEEYVDEIRGIWDSRWLTNMGEKHKSLEDGLKSYLDVPYLQLFVNGHLGLEMSLQILNLTGEVITTPFTFASTTHAIVRNGLKPVFCDIRPDDYTIDPERIEALITDRTSAIVPVHVYGHICDVDAIKDIADRHGLKVIYDAAHAFGESYRGESVGCFGDLSMFSFHATKVFNSIEGGAVSFTDEKYLHRLYCIKNYGITDEEHVEQVGGNAKMNEFQAAMGLCNLRHIDDYIARRRIVWERYMERLEGIRGLKLPCGQPDVKRNYSYFPVTFDEGVFGASRDEISAALLSHGIHARKYFYPLTNAFDCYRGIYNPEDTPAALSISRRILTLPMYADLAAEDVDEICRIILSCQRP